MYNIQTDFSKVIPWEVAFPNIEFGQHGQEKVGFGSTEKSVDNPTEVTVEYFTGDRLLEKADFDSGGSSMGATAGGDRDYIIFDADGHTLGVLEYRVGDQPRLKVNGATVPGGASRFTSFVSETGAADEDPKPQSVSDESGQYKANRESGHGAHKRGFVTIRRLNVVEGEAHAALTLNHIGQNPRTDVTFPPPDTCPTCGSTKQ